MNLQEGEEMLHELRPERAVLWIWLCAKALPVGLVGGGVGFGLLGLAGLIFSFGGFSFIGGDCRGGNFWAGIFDAGYDLL